MRTSEKGIELIKEFEGVRLTSYICAAGKTTIGYGHTGPDVTASQAITLQRADELLEEDLLKFEIGVTKAVKVPLEQCEFDSLVAFAFNVGLGNFRASTLLRLLNEGKKDDAAVQFLRWDKAGDKVLPGLTRRRQAEMKLFLGDRH